ncbi:MAG: transporter substrate-binding domain-containing protein [Rhodobacterales bacterium]|nr:transporter substrate-binding domain-containing protein [Rhodobacterales bacterium]
MIRALVLSLLLAAPPAEAESWVIGTEADYAPYIYHDRNGALTGLDKDLGDAICAAAEVSCIWAEVAFDDLMPGIASGQFDLVLAGIGETPARSESASFTTPYRGGGTSYGVFAGLTDGMHVEGALIAVQSGTVHQEWLVQTGRKVRGYPTQEDTIRALITRQVDLVFGSSSYMQHAFETDYPQLRIVGTEEFPSAGAAVAVDKKNPALLDQVNAILQSMMDDGSLETILNRWFLAGAPV